jgi:hypothetical protein
MIHWYECVGPTPKYYMTRSSFIIGTTSYQTLIRLYDIPGDFCKVSCILVRYRQHCGRTDSSAAVFMTLSPCRLETMCKCLNTRRKIYILSSRTKEEQKKPVGFSQNVCIDLPTLHMIWYMIRYDMMYMIWYVMIWYVIWYMWYDVIWYMLWYNDIWYDIFVNYNWVATRWQ